MAKSKAALIDLMAIGIKDCQQVAHALQTPIFAENALCVRHDRHMLAH